MSLLWHTGVPQHLSCKEKHDNYGDETMDVTLHYFRAYSFQISIRQRVESREICEYFGGKPGVFVVPAPFHIGQFMND